MITQGYGGARMAAPNKKVARSNKSRAVVLATNKARRQRGRMLLARDPIAGPCAAASFTHGGLHVFR